MTGLPMKQVIKKERVEVGCADEEAARRPASAPAQRAARAPGVHLVRIDGRVQAIEVTCRCGDVSVLEVDYEGTNPQPEATS